MQVNGDSNNSSGASNDINHAVDERSLLADAKSHPISLRFAEKSLENEYLRDTYTPNVSYANRILIFLLFGLPLAILVHGMVLQWDFPKSAILGYATMFTLGLTFVFAIPYIPKKPHIIERTSMAFLFLLASAVLFMVFNAPLQRRLTASTCVFVLVMFLQAFPLQLVYSVISISLILGALFAGFLNMPDVSGENILGLTVGAIFALMVSFVLAYQSERNRRIQFLLIRKVDGLLRNTFPATIVEDLKKGKGTSVKRYEESTVLFADIAGFTNFAMGVDPENIVKILNDLFSRFDAALKQYPAEKIKTIGDAYMVAVGLPTKHPCHLQIGAELAMDLREAVRKYTQLTGVPLSVRIGMHTGPVVAGIIGHTKFLYDLWGDTVNIASRMEALGVPGEIQVTKEVRNQLMNLYEFTEVGEVEVKGRGQMTTYLLKRPNSAMIHGEESRQTDKKTAA